MKPADWTLPAEGSCRCGRVRFRVERAPLLTGVCHCRGCQKMTASAFSTTVTIGEDAFVLVEGETVIGGLHGDDVEHHHCDRCKSWIYTRPVPAMGFVNVRASLLDDPAPFVPFIETQTAEKFGWAQTGATVSFERFPALEEYQGLMERFVAEMRAPQESG